MYLRAESLHVTITLFYDSVTLEMVFEARQNITAFVLLS